VQNLLDTFSTAYFAVELLLGLLLGRVPCFQWELMFAHLPTPISGLQKPISPMRRSLITKDNHFSPEVVRHATETQLK